LPIDTGVRVAGIMGDDISREKLTYKQHDFLEIWTLKFDSDKCG